MEPALGERDDGSQKTSLLTCEDRAACEQRQIGALLFITVDLSRCTARPLTWVRALPGVPLTTGALALRR
jgi:hypothetical protein